MQFRTLLSIAILVGAVGRVSATEEHGTITKINLETRTIAYVHSNESKDYWISVPKELKIYTWNGEPKTLIKLEDLKVGDHIILLGSGGNPNGLYRDDSKKK